MHVVWAIRIEDCKFITSVACRLEQLPWDSLPSTCSTACLRRAPRSTPYKYLYRLERTWCSPCAGTACRRHAPCSAACRLKQLPLSSPRAGSACLRRAPCIAPCRLEPYRACRAAGLETGGEWVETGWRPSGVWTLQVPVLILESLGGGSSRSVPAPPVLPLQLHRTRRVEGV